MHTQTTGAGQLGDRLAGFSVCLPAEPQGTVLLVCEEHVAAALTARYPGALIHRPGDAFPAADTVGLLVVEPHRVPVEEYDALARSVAAGAVVAVIGDRGDLMVHPDLVRPEQVWRHGWPTSVASRGLPRVRRRLGLERGRRQGTSRLSFTGGDFESLADRVAADLGAALGDRFELAGVMTAGHTILRLRGTVLPDVAVRLSLTDPTADLAVDQEVARQVPDVGDLLPPVIARGRTCGHPWSATPWVPDDERRAAWLRPARRRTDQVLRDLVDRLAATRLGSTGPGWADRWLDEVDLVASEDRARVGAALRRLEGGLPTGWCHGDPWPANVLDPAGRPAVIDWGNASPEAPLGLDHVLMAAFRASSDGEPFAVACARLVARDELDSRRDPDATTDAVAGASWRVWDPQLRAALALAAAVRHLRNRSLVDLSPERLAAEQAGLRRLADLALEEPPAAPSTAPTGAATISGAGWLGLGAGVVKGAQTVVLLILAALLAPSDMGVLAIGALVLNVTSAVTDLGSSTALVHWRGDAERAARSALSLAVGLAAVLTVGAWFAAPSLARVLNGGETGVDVIRGLMFCLPMFAVAGVSQELMRRALAFKRRVLPDIVGALSGAVLSVVLAAAGWGAMSLVLGQLLQAALVMVLCWLMRPPVRFGWSRTDLGGLLAYGGHLAGASILQLLILNVDYLLVANRLGADELGVYSMAFRLGYMPFLLVGMVIGGAAFAHLCRLRGREVGRAAGDSALSMLALVLPLYLGMVLLAPQLELLGEQWAPGVVALRWLAAYGLVLSLRHLCLVTLNAVGRTRDSFLINLAHLALLSGLLLWWVDRGVTMVAVAQFVVGALTVTVLRRHVDGFAWVELARRTVPLLVGAVAMSAVALLLGQLLPWTRVSYPGLLLVGSLTLAAYLVPVLALDRTGVLPLPAALTARLSDPRRKS